jgi:lipopolysaccharide export system protein LptA
VSRYCPERGGKNKIASAAEPVTIGTGVNHAGAETQQRPARLNCVAWRTIMSNQSPRGRRRRFCGRRLQIISLIALVVSLLSSGTHGLPDDGDQPIRITADTAIRDEKQGFTVYSGNVHMIQGSMDIVADTITIFHETAQADKIVAEGKPAKMQQRPAVDEPLVRARAEIIEYYKTEDRVHLKINAHITQDGSSVTGDSIDYYIADELVKAGSDEAPDGQRVIVVIEPKVLRDEDGDNGPSESN